MLLPSSIISRTEIRESRRRTDSPCCASIRPDLHGAINLLSRARTPQGHEDSVATSPKGRGKWEYPLSQSFPPETADTWKRETQASWTRDTTFALPRWLSHRKMHDPTGHGNFCAAQCPISFSHTDQDACLGRNARSPRVKVTLRDGLHGTAEFLSITGLLDEGTRTCKQTAAR